MELTKKKIIAREFLILVACALLSVLAFIGTKPYNYIVESRIKSLETEYQSLSDTINKIDQSYLYKIKKQKNFIYNMKSNDRLTTDENYREFWIRMKEWVENGKMRKFYEGLRSDMRDFSNFGRQTGLKTLAEMEDFLQKYSLTPKEVLQNTNRLKLIEEKKGIKGKIKTEKYNVKSFYDRLEFALTFFKIVVLLGFPIRYVFYGVKWSIKILKN